MRGLPPALRRKRRYVAFEIVRFQSDEQGSDGVDKLEARDFLNELWGIVLSLYGEWYGNLGLKLEVFDGKKGIVRCSRDKVNALVVALTLITEIKGVRVAVITTGVSGTIKGCMRFLRTSDPRTSEQ